MLPNLTEQQLEAIVGEPVVCAMLFMPPGARSLFTIMFRLAQRAVRRGGLAAQFWVGGNVIVVTETRVMLYRGISQPLRLLASWRRTSVTGTAKSKHWTGRGAQAHDQGLLRTTLVTPNGAVTLDLDEVGGGRAMLQALAIALPEQATSKSWATGPDN